MNEVSDDLRHLTTQRIQSSPTHYTPPNETIALALARVFPVNEPQYVTVESDNSTTILYRANMIGSNPNPPWRKILVERKNTGVSARIDARNFGTRMGSIGDASDLVFENLIEKGVSEHVIWYASHKMPTWIPKLKELFDEDVRKSNPNSAKFKRMDIIMLFLDIIGMTEDEFTYQTNDGDYVTVNVPTFPTNPLSFMSFVNSCCEGDTGFEKEVHLNGLRTLKFVTRLSDNTYYMFPCSKTEGSNYGFTYTGNVLKVTK